MELGAEDGIYYGKEQLEFKGGSLMDQENFDAQNSDHLYKGKVLAK